MKCRLACRRAGSSSLGLLALLAMRLALAVDSPVDRGIGGRVANFTLDDTAGKPVSLSGFRGKNAVVLVFLGTDCPIGTLYAPRLAELSRRYEGKGVAFLGVNANAHETAEQVAEHARGHG